MTPAHADALAAEYRRGLLEDTLPFWTAHAVDREHGGFLTCLGRDGAVIDTDKPVWAQGRFTWLLATMYTCVEARPEWLELARHGVEFLERHAFAADGGMYFLVARDGRPLRRRRYVYSEAFAAMAFAAYAHAAESERHAAPARALFERFTHASFTAGALPPKVDPGTRPMKAIGPPMIAINAAQVLRETIGDGDGALAAWIGRCIDEIRRDFVKPDLEAVLETVAPDGAVIDHFDGRTLNPGHAIEAAWLVLYEACVRDDDELAALGCRMLDWMWARGWDETHGGLVSFCDLHGGPVQEYCHDMKFWWPHCEAMIATLLAHVVTGDPRYERMHEQVRAWAQAHFPDAEHGEWFGYLNRDGSVSVPLKGNHWKGPYHVPRMQWLCGTILDRGRPGAGGHGGGHGHGWYTRKA